MPNIEPPPVFMERATEVAWTGRGNLFRVADPNTGVIRIVEAAVLAECISNAARAYRDYRTSESAIVIEFPGIGAA